MTKAFVFGKFLPFHKGHEAMIRFGLEHADFLSVLVCCSDKENIKADTRMQWIAASFYGLSKLEIRAIHYNEDELPNSSDSSRAVSEVWSVTFKKVYPDFSLLITSEPYGAFVAEYMNIRHIAFDIPRQYYPVSATAVRNDLKANWHFLTDAVKRYHLLKVVVLGTESTGKTTLSRMLAEHFGCSLVSEAGRDIVQDSRAFEFSDLEKIALEHARRINEASLTDSPLMIIDTDIHITKSYARFVFDRELPVTDEIYSSNKAALYIYLANDVEYVQDGTRLAKEDRDRLDQFHRRELGRHDIRFTEVFGNWNQRFEKAVALINKLLN